MRKADTMQLPLAAHNRLIAHRSTRRSTPCAIKKPDQCTPDQHDFGRLAKAAAVAAAVVAFAGSVGAARAESAWKPRRHHWHIGERISDTWADAIVEVRRVALD